MTARLIEVGRCPAYPGCGCGTQSGPHACEHVPVKITSEQFTKLPLKVKRKWWTETIYGKHPQRASAELQREIAAICSPAP